MRQVRSRTLAGILAEQWHAENLAAGPKETAMGSRFRHSDAGACERAIALTALKVDAEPMDISGSWVTRIGTIIHEMWQEALTEALVEGSVLVELKVGDFDVYDGSGHLDALINDNGYLICYELKTMGGASFRRAVGAPSGGWQKTAKAYGPGHSHLVQGSLNAHLSNADELRIGYLGTEAIGLGKGFNGLDRFSAEWVLSKDEFTPLALDEINRVNRILATVDNGVIPARVYPDNGTPIVISQPETTNWPCQYCKHRTTCVRLGAGEKSVGQL